MTYSSYVIIREARHTINGVYDAGDVYVTRVALSPNVFSSTKRLAGAARWSYEDGVEAIRTHQWIGARLQLAGEAVFCLPIVKVRVPS